jgi:hypothetical protein
VIDIADRGFKAAVIDRVDHDSVTALCFTRTKAESEASKWNMQGHASSHHTPGKGDLTRASSSRQVSEDLLTAQLPSSTLRRPRTVVEVPSEDWLEFAVARSPGNMKVSDQAARLIG